MGDRGEEGHFCPGPQLKRAPQSNESLSFLWARGFCMHVFSSILQNTPSSILRAKSEGKK